MKPILFTQPPRWIKTEQGYSRMLVSGSRWPHANPVRSQPDKPANMPGSNYTQRDYTPYPFTLGSAAAWMLRVQGAHRKVRCLDSVGRCDSLQAWVEMVTGLDPEWLILESSTTSNAIDLSIIQQLKEKAKLGSKIILTGTHMAARGRELMESEHGKYLHAIVSHEYEKGVESVICDGKTGFVEGTLLTVD